MIVAFWSSLFIFFLAVCPLISDQPTVKTDHAPAASEAFIPHLEQRGAATQLIVDGKSFLLLGGKPHNSSSSSIPCMTSSGLG
ncbi:hypothetical protein HDF16_002762 [Granulicella aggregans]|uniref:Uncharacterized protein n=1 Tax=Granulicella aggregans TaxID=474949 RepID=A0A7W7ZDS5_9BACT|nr:hypothetical protein [Granulicella aggregans]